MPDSSTGGYLAPSSIGGDVNDQALQTFIQAVVVGITGLPGNLVRPRWQQEPPNIPDVGINWAAIGPGQRERDPFAAVVQGANNTTVIRNRVVEILCSFYGPAAEATGELLAMGFEVPQNREALTYVSGQWTGFNLVSGVSGPVIAPALLKGRWYRKADYSFRVRQQQKYTYPVLTVESATGIVELQQPGSNTPISTPINAAAPQS